MSKLDAIESVYSLISNHTHFNLFKVFLPPERRQYVLDALVFSGASKSRAGIVKSHCGATEQLAYCPECRTRDFYLYGFSYWHFEHSVVGVEACPYHDSELLKLDISRKKYGTRGLCLPPISEKKKQQTRIFEKYLFIAQQVLALLKDNSDHYHNRFVYQRVLTNHGLVTKDKHIRIALLTEIVRDWVEDLRYTEPYSRLYSALDIERNWVANIVAGKPGLYHPLKHIIIWGALGINKEDMDGNQEHSFKQIELNLKKDATPIIDEKEVIGQYLKLGSAQKVAKHIGLCVNTVLAILDKNNVDRQRKPKYITSLVRKSVCDLSDAGASTREIANQLGILIASVNRIKRTLA